MSAVRPIAATLDWRKQRTNVEESQEVARGAPDMRSRVNENWSVLLDRTPEPIKFVPLSEDGKIWASTSTPRSVAP